MSNEINRRIGGSRFNRGGGKGKNTGKGRTQREIAKRRGRGRGNGNGGGASSPLVVESMQFTVSQSTGNQTITLPSAPGWTPKLAIFTGVMSSALDTLQDAGFITFGAADGTSQFAFCHTDADGNDPSQIKRYGTKANVILGRNTGSDATFLEASFVGFVENGITINVDKATASDRSVNVMFIGGDDVSVDVGVTTLTTDAAAKTVTPGFEMKALITAHNVSGTTSLLESVFGLHGSVGLGFSSYDGSTIRQCAHQYYAPSGASNGDPRSANSSTKAAVFRAPAAAAYNLTLGNITSTAFDLTVAGADLSLTEIGYIAIGGCSAFAAMLDSPAATGAHSWTGVGFEPLASVMVLTQRSTVATVEVLTPDAGAMGVSFVTTGDEMSSFFTNEDGAPAMNTKNKTSTKGFELTTDDGTASFVGVFTSFDADGMTANFTASEGSAHKWPALFLAAA